MANAPEYCTLDGTRNTFDGKRGQKMRHSYKRQSFAPVIASHPLAAWQSRAASVVLSALDCRIAPLLAMMGKGAILAATAHRSHKPNTFITSSPKWLMTFTAIRPVSGRGKGRDVSR